MRLYGLGRNWAGIAGVTLTLVLLASVEGRLARPRVDPTPDPVISFGFTWAPLDGAAMRALDLPSSTHGIVVTSVASGGRADRAGLEIGDVVTSVDGREPMLVEPAGPHRFGVLHRGVAYELSVD